MLQSPKSLYEISLNTFCEFLYNWSQPTTKSNQDENRNYLRLISFENHPAINLIFSNNHTRQTQLFSSRPSSTDNLANFGHIDDKLSSLKKSCHNLVSTFFGRKSLESLQEEYVKEETLPPANLNFRIPENICQDIIQHYQCYFKMNDRTLSFPIFDGDVNPIVNFQIEDATQITAEGLKVFKKHNLIRLKMANLTNCTITELINNLSSWSIYNIESFSVPYCSLTRFNKICIILSLTRLTNLLYLDVSNTSFNNQCLEIITDHLPNITSLNISSTKVSILKPLLKMAKLRRLNLHNVALTCKDEAILASLNQLEFLDISDQRVLEEQPRNQNNENVGEFFLQFFQFNNLTELDISGRKLSPFVIFRLIRCRVHQHMSNPEIKLYKFIGLMSSLFTLTDLFDLDARTDKKIFITSTAKLKHIIQALIRYKDRPVFLQRALFALSQYTFSHNINSDEMPLNEAELMEEFDTKNDIEYNYNDAIDNNEILAAESRVDPNEINPYLALLVDLVVGIMETHIKNLHLILLASGNLYNLTRNNPNIHPNLLKRVVNICIETLKHHPSEYQITKNILLTLCLDRILQDITFDRYTCITIVMDTLFHFHDTVVNRLALCICTMLAAKMPKVENALLGTKSPYIKRLLDLIRESNALNSQNNEMILRLALSTLWNFTDEAPKTCELFIKMNGIKDYVDTLVLFEGKNNIETKILGLLNNIAEVLYLRSHLIRNSRLLHQLRKLIYSEHIDVSYFAIGILAQLASDQNLCWDWIENFEINTVLQEMLIQIQLWPNPSFEMVAYRSFEPFMSLLLNDRHSSISLWALWAIHHVNTKKPNKYCRMLYEENCIQTIVLILTQRLQKHYSIYCSKQRREISQRLINLVTIVDDEYQKLSKYITTWNCYLVHKWSEDKGQLETETMNTVESLNECTHKSNPNRINERTKLTEKSCDCILKYFLDHDSFLRLSSIILKSYQCFSPFPLKLE